MTRIVALAALCLVWCVELSTVGLALATEGDPAADQGDATAGGGGGLLDQARDSFTEAIRGLLNPLPDREGPCPGGRQVVDKFGRKRCVSDSGSKAGSDDTPPPSPVGGTGKGTSDKGLYESIADTLTDAMRALFNPLPDREGPCPGGREVIDKFGRKRCVTDSESREGSEEPGAPSEGGTGSASKGFFDTVADTVTDALSALFNPLPDREGPCPGGREVIDKFGRKRCVTDSESGEGFEAPGAPSEGGTGSSSKGVFDTVADTLTDALGALFNPLPDREGPCPGGREVVDKFGRKRCVAEGGSDADESGLPSEGTGAGGTSEKGIFESVVDTVTDSLAALLNPMADREEQCPGGRVVIDKFGRKRCVTDAASADDTKTEDPSAGGDDASASTPEGNPDPAAEPGDDKPGYFEEMGGKFKEVLAFLLNPLPEREEACKDGHLFVDKYGRKRCVSRASDSSGGSDEPASPVEDSKNKPVSEGDYRSEDSTAMPDTGSDSEPKGDEESIPKTGAEASETPSLFDRMKDSFGAAIAFLLNPMPDREGPCGGGRQVVDRFGRKRCVSGGR